MSNVHRNLNKIWYPEPHKYLIRRVFVLSWLIVLFGLISFYVSSKITDYYSDLEFNSRMVDRFTAKNDILGIYTWLCHSSLSKDLQGEWACTGSEPPKDIIAQASQYLLSLEKGTGNKYIQANEVATDIISFNQQYENKKNFYERKNEANNKIRDNIPFWEFVQLLCQVITVVFGIFSARYSYLSSKPKD